MDQEEMTFKDKVIWILYTFALMFVIFSLLGGFLNFFGIPSKSYFYICLNTVNEYKDVYVLKDNDSCENQNTTFKLEVAK